MRTQFGGVIWRMPQVTLLRVTVYAIIWSYHVVLIEVSFLCNDVACNTVTPITLSCYPTVTYTIPFVLVPRRRIQLHAKDSEMLAQSIDSFIGVISFTQT